MLRLEYDQLLTVLRHLGDYAEAARLARTMPQQFPKGALEHIRAGSCLLNCALKAATDERLTPERRQTLARSYVDQGAELLLVAVRLGPDDGKVRQSILRGLQGLPSVEDLRAYPRFRQLLKELGEDAPQ
jgi:hypothetical protein